jgi:hypothetical protein
MHMTVGVRTKMVVLFNQVVNATIMRTDQVAVKITATREGLIIRVDTVSPLMKMEWERDIIVARVIWTPIKIIRELSDSQSLDVINY